MFASGTLDTVFRQRGLLYFQKALLVGMLGRAWAAMSGRSRQLGRPPRGGQAGGHFAGLQIVPLSQIRGTEGRSRDFDADFNPLSDQTLERWLRVFVAWERGRALPPVELLRAGEVYYVRDGHHRVSVARALGQEFIEAAVTVVGR